MPDREPVWCHHCGCYSFEDEWGHCFPDDPDPIPDICPVCDDHFPAFPLQPGLLPPDRAAAAARDHECIW